MYGQEDPVHHHQLRHARSRARSSAPSCTSASRSTTPARAPAERAKAAGIKTFLCVNHYATNPASFERCRGFAEAIGADFKTSTIDCWRRPHANRSQGLAPTCATTPTPRRCWRWARPRRILRMKALREAGPKGKIWLRDLRPVGRDRQGHQGRLGQVRHRPAALPAGLHPGRRAGDHEEGKDHRSGQGDGRPQGQREVQGPPRPSTGSSRRTARATSARARASSPRTTSHKVEKYAGQYR